MTAKSTNLTDSTDRERLATVESEVTRLHSDIRKVGHDVRQLATVVSDGFKSMSNAGRTDWKVIFGGFAVGFTLLGMIFSVIGAGYLRDLTRVENNTKLHQVELVSSGKAVSGHDIRISGLESQITLLDTVLQREMRLLDRAGDEKIKGLDTRLQQEMRLIIASLKVELAEIKRRISVSEGWRDNHDKRVVGLNAAQWERIRALERKVFGQPGMVKFGAPPGG